MTPDYRLPDPSKPLEEQDPTILFALALWGEARGECMAAQMGVAWTIINRVRKGGWFGKGLKGVLLKPLQFSCFNHNDPNRAKMLSPLRHDSETAWRRCWFIARDFADYIHTDYEGPFPGVTGYYDSSLDDNPPSWAKNMELVVRKGRLRFFRERKS